MNNCWHDSNQTCILTIIMRIIIDIANSESRAWLYPTFFHIYQRCFSRGALLSPTLASRHHHNSRIAFAVAMARTIFSFRHAKALLHAIELVCCF
jgi:hypothetical protein